MSAEATAPGKMILFGEHSVVYRGPAILLAVDRRASVVASKRDDKRVYIDSEDLGFSGYFDNGEYTAVTGKVWRGRNMAALEVATRKVMAHLGVDGGVNLKVRSMIPIAVGLGSSAAVCVATTAAVGELFDGNLSKEKIAELSFEGEKVIHGNPSGADNSIATYGGIMRYERGVGLKRLKLDKPLPFVIGNTRKKRSTRNMVEGVKELKDRNPEVVDPIIYTMAGLSQTGLDALLRRDTGKLGDLMNINHGLLTSIGVSTQELDDLVYAARREGALGAKLTGAGGGGCMIALAEEEHLGMVEKGIRAARGYSMRVNLTDEGVTTRRL
ncbi:MAG: mevalonate kinase [Candidatus Bathyarchaeota archaeon]|nr:mevalonate kinase [Candidatus Bathyarchaeota archaeon]